MKKKSSNKRFLLFVLSFFLLAGLFVVRQQEAVLRAEETEETKAPLVKPVSIDYEELWVIVDANGNGTVYYTDKTKKNWSEAIKRADGKYQIDISWLSLTSTATLNLKGDLSEEIVSVTIPAPEKKIKAVYQKKNGQIVFSNVPEEYTQFEWRIATSYDWHTAVNISDATTAGSAFLKEIEKLRTSGAKIIIRLAQVPGKLNAEGTFEPGNRPSKEIKLTISKRGTAPKVTIDGSKMTVSTKKTMEYSMDLGTTWVKATDKMALADFAPASLGNGARNTAVLIRYAATEKNDYSKQQYLEIPAQRSAPSVSSADGNEIVFSSSQDKTVLTFNLASKTTPYEYAVVKNGTEFNPLKCSWKGVTSVKQISLSKKTAPSGSKIYFRKKMIKASKTAEFQLASAAFIVTIP